MAHKDKRISRARSSTATPVKQSAVPSEKNTTGSHASPMYAERLKNLYGAMLKCRALNDLIRARAGRHGCCDGGEGIIAGAAIHLKPDDLVAPSSVELLARGVQGASPHTLVAINKRQEKGRATDAVMLEAPLESTAIAMATGMALACKLQNNGLVTCCIVPAPALAASPCEAVRFAANRKLAIVFVIIARVSSGPDELVELRSETQDALPVIAVDGNDVVAVYRVAEECTRRARQGLGPSLIYCEREPEADPIPFMENYLRQRRLFSEDWKQSLMLSIRRQMTLVAKGHLRSSTAK